MNRYAPAFTYETELLYNNSGTAISKGCLVTWSGSVSSVEDPIPEPALGKKPQLDNQSARSTGTTRPVLGIQLHAGSTVNHPIGVAVDDISDGEWGLIATKGPVDVRITASQNIAAGDYLVGTAGGVFKEDATSVTAVTVIHAMALEATITSGTCAAALITAQLNIPSGGAMGKRA